MSPHSLQLGDWPSNNLSTCFRKRSDEGNRISRCRFWISCCESGGQQSFSCRSTSEQLLQGLRVQSYLLKPRGWQARLFCVCFWIAAAIGLGLGCYFLVPLLLTKVIIPLQALIKVCWQAISVVVEHFCMPVLLAFHLM